METKNYTGLVPQNVQGKEITAESKIVLQSSDEAVSFYNTARKRLLYVHNWMNVAGTLGADFMLTDENGNESDRLAQKGDHFRIDIPGPGSRAGEGYDWAYVEDIKEVHLEKVDSVAMRVRPAANPKTDNQNVAHFFSDVSSSTFVITREYNTVTASIYDRNIEANEEIEEPTDKVRNAIVGLGAKFGISKLQWKALTDGLVNADDSRKSNNN
jgi:hypothetical protein